MMKFTVVYNNVRGMKSKLNSIKNIAQELNPTLMCFVETHLSDIEKIEIDNYVIIRNDRNDRNENGGGILIAYKKELENVIIEIENSKKHGAESMWILLNNKINENKNWSRICSPRVKNQTSRITEHVPRNRKTDYNSGKKLTKNITNGRF